MRKADYQKCESVSWKNSTEIDEHKKRKSGKAEPFYMRHKNESTYMPGREGKALVTVACPEGR